MLEVERKLEVTNGISESNRGSIVGNISTFGI